MGKYTTDSYEQILDKLENSIAEHELIYDESGQPMDYKYIYVNDAFCKGLNVSEKDLIGRAVSEVFPNIEYRWIKIYSEIVKTGVAKKFVDYSVQFHEYFDVYAFKTGEHRFVTSFHNVTKQLKNNKKFQQDEELLRTFRDNTKAAFFEFDLSKKLLSYSDNLEEIIGRKDITLEDYRNLFIHLVHPDDRAKIEKLNHNLIRNRISEVTVEIRIYNETKKVYVWISFFMYVAQKVRDFPINIKGIIRDISEEKFLETEALERNMLFEEAKKVANMVTFLYYPQSMSFEYNPKLSHFLGFDNLEYLEEYRKVIHPADLHVFDRSTDSIITDSVGETTKFRAYVNGEIKYLQSSIFGIKNDEGKTSKVFGILRDITGDQHIKSEMERTNRSFRQIFNTSPAGIFILDENFNITIINESFKILFNLEEPSFFDVFDQKSNSIMDLLVEKGELKRFETRYQKNDRDKYFLITVVEMMSGLQNKYQGTVIDITDRKKSTERIEYLATRDTLTSLFNRNYFEEHTKNISFDEHPGMLICDIDGLKLINDAFGHLEGDKLLVSFANYLSDTFTDEVIARLGGDEFAILTNNKTFDDLEQYKNKIKDFVTEIILFGIHVDISVGYSIMQEEMIFEDMFRLAENRMYHHKLMERSSRKSHSVNTIMETLHQKTEETKEHCERVAVYAEELLRLAGHSRVYEVEEIRLISQVHDIGKIAISETILNKPGLLTVTEMLEMKSHCESGFKIASNIINNEEIALAVLYHHERYDGTGYPHQLEKDQIPLYARIISIADSYDTMISGRHYQKPISKELAKNELLINKGKQFDPELVDFFIKYLENSPDL